MKSPRRLLLFLSFLMTMFFTQKEVTATHASGAEIVYEHLGGRTYRFFFKFYRDCSLNPITGNPATAQEPNTVDLCFYNSCTNTSYTKLMTKWTGALPPYGGQNGSLVTRGCSNALTDCESPSSPVPGYEEWWYSCIETLPAKCNSWKFAAWVNARNPSNNIVGGLLYVETTFDNSVIDANSSPYFSIKPIPYVCLNQQYSFNNGAVDADGDSLVSQMINPLVGNSCQNPATNIGLNMTQTPAITFPGNPMQTGGSFSLNPSSGQMLFTPTQVGPSTLSIRTTEYRNGQPHGSIIRDVQVQVLQCTTVYNGLDTPSLANSIKGGKWLNNQINACIDQELEFDFDVNSADTNTVLILEDNTASALPAATVTYQNQKTDAVSGKLVWTPTVADVGLNNIIITIKDSTCRPPGILIVKNVTIPIYVWPPLTAVPDTNICNNEAAFLGVTGGGDYTWTILPGGTPNSLNNPNIANPIATPKKTTSYVVTSGATDYCPNNKDTVEITVLEGPKFQGQDDVVGCPSNPIELDLKPTPPANATYAYKWTPTTYLNSSTIADPTATTPVDITYYVEVTSSVNKCIGRDTVEIDVLDGFSIENPDTTICLGESIVIRGTGDSRYSYLWNDTSVNSSFDSKTIIDATITPMPHGKYTYTLAASHTVCPNDSTTSITVEVQPVPTVQVSPDASLCFGDTIGLKGEVTPAYTGYTYKWNPGSSLDDDAILTPVFTATGTTTLVLTASTGVGCVGTDSVTVSVYPAKFVDLSSDTAICPGDTARLTLTVPAGTEYRWYPDQNISSTGSLTPNVWPVANRRYMVAGKDANNCKDTSYVKVVVRPKAILHLPDTVRIYPGEQYEMDPEGNCLYYSWFPELGLSNPRSGHPIAKPEVNTRYIVKGNTEGGCTVTDSVDVLVMDDSYVKLPNAFAPGNGRNSVFKIVGRGQIELKRFVVYNRWGAKMFETKDINEGWDGRFNDKPQPMGVYIYTVEGTTPGGRNITQQGNVTLVR